MQSTIFQRCDVGLRLQKTLQGHSILQVVVEVQCVAVDKQTEQFNE